jgi:hypothetical protein
MPATLAFPRLQALHIRSFEKPCSSASTAATAWSSPKPRTARVRMPSASLLLDINSMSGGTACGLLLRASAITTFSRTRRLCESERRLTVRRRLRRDSEQTSAAKFPHDRDREHDRRRPRRRQREHGRGQRDLRQRLRRIAVCAIDVRRCRRWTSEGDGVCRTRRCVPKSSKASTLREVSACAPARRPMRARRVRPRRRPHPGVSRSPGQTDP